MGQLVHSYRAIIRHADTRCVFGDVFDLLLLLSLLSLLLLLLPPRPLLRLVVSRVGLTEDSVHKRDAKMFEKLQLKLTKVRTYSSMDDAGVRHSLPSSQHGSPTESNPPIQRSLPPCEYWTGAGNWPTPRLCLLTLQQPYCNPNPNPSRGPGPCSVEQGVVLRHATRVAFNFLRSVDVAVGPVAAEHRAPPCACFSIVTAHQGVTVVGGLLVLFGSTRDAIS